MKKVLLWLVLAVLLASFTFGVKLQPSHAQAGQTLTIFAASSLTDAFKEVETAFEAAHPGVDVVYSFGSSSILATQLKEGAPADIFASANNSQMNVAQDAKRIAGAPRTFAKNRLVLIVPSDNPAKIVSLKDLAKPGIKLVVAAPKVPVRDYTDAMLNKLVNVPGYGEDYKAAVIKNFVSEEDNVRQVSAKVSLGEADAGIVYRSDVTPDIADKVTALPIPDAVNTLATYPIAITNDSANADLAQAFIDYVLTAEGQQTLLKWNFISIVIPVLPSTIMLETDAALHVTGQLFNPLKLTVDDLKNNYAAQKVDVSYLSGEDTVSASFTGVYLRDILDSTQVNLNADVKNDKLSLYIVATGSDGYQAIIAYGEIDPDFANQPILVAYEQDGKAIADTQGAIRLIVPGDKHGGRYVSGLVSLDVRDAPTVGK
jgi:molybdate transport system substrate-binding protein